MSHHVIVLGGGVAGMSTAHELIERGFDVTVYEMGDAGGKARSFGIPGTGKNGRRDLPAEHGFRFFPGFYRHLPDTMKRIPFGPGRTSVFDNLVPATEMLIHFKGHKQIVVPSRFPRSFDDISKLLVASGYLTTETGLKPDDIEFYSERVWQLLTSCEERRAEDLEKVSWWDYIGAERRSDEYKAYLGRTPRVLVAADPTRANTKTVGDVLLQLLFNLGDPGVAADRVLNGPTNEMWIAPWLQYLERRGVRYHEKAEVTAFRCAGDRIAAVRIRQNGIEREHTADYYVSALPVEKMAPLITPDMRDLDETLNDIRTLAAHVDWMNGVQFYLLEDLPLNFGHQMFLSSPWALTSLSQVQFWYDRPEAFGRDYGDGTVRTVLSVDVSDWNNPAPRNGKPAKRHTRDEAAKEVWLQLKDSLPGLADAHLHRTTPWAVDVAIQAGNGELRNAEPLLVNRPKSWARRPWARTRIPNFFLAADYVRTYTNLATMEAANEAARRAVNAIIDASRVRTSPCRLWELHEPIWVKPWRWWDLCRYRRGEPWGAEFPEFVEAMARGVLESAPAVGGPDEYADAAAREATERGIGLVPPYVLHDVTDVLLRIRSALERGDVAELLSSFDAGANIDLEDSRIQAYEWLEALERFFAEGGRIDLDIRSLEDVRPHGLAVVATFAADMAVLGERPPIPGRPGRLDVTLQQVLEGPPGAARAWRVHALRYTARG
jgi:15-cis-phytoene desaturase